ncbi:hypothetical protein JJ691_65780 [Kutzneria sp. CA-103260]|nr:hypothetical protein JJ691_65760 [Kutzneria sp. CA-103260]QUQ68830.1 hypothetical protein JJ691_65770 [Kutzneria sp. CA-103260]QUQ68831.1 hypothetical protein JJ691_65780 [Kutzneria sp. CA-103260]
MENVDIMNLSDEQLDDLLGGAFSVDPACVI